jgi:DnaJ family protein C protein 17
MPSNKDKLPDQDPYDLLGIAFHASKAEISKAYRKLALKLHPDKQTPGNPALAEEIAKKFHDVKEARSFLLDDDHSEARRRYDAKRESDRLRQQTEALREKNMSERRKRLREELKEKEFLAVRQRKENNELRQQKKEGDIVNQLRREGKRKRQEYAERDAQKKEDEEAEAERMVHIKTSANKKSERDQLERRQVRLKWDRKKMRPSPSEDSLAKLFSEQFGSIEKVELLARKGNQALVTFENRRSCRPCVDFYAASLFMRAKYVGKRKEEEEHAKEDHRAQELATDDVHRGSMDESLEERRMRQAVERERLLRELEEDDNTGDLDSSSKLRKNTSGGVKNNKEKRERSNRSSTKVSNFPLEFPNSADWNALSSIEALQKFESQVFGRLMSEENIASMQASAVSNVN